MQANDLKISEIVSWYTERVRPFLEEADSEKIGDYDTDIQRLRTLGEALDRPLEVCFLGEGGVGKSTLLNALIAGHDTLVPSGGIGPLTAQALSVRFGDRRDFVVEYHGRGRLHNLVFALTKGYDKEFSGNPLEPLEATPDEIGDGGAAERAVVEVLPADVEERRRKLNYYRKQAQLLITGSQDNEADLPYLVDRLREALGQNTISGSTCRPEDSGRVARLRDALAAAGERRELCFSEETCNGDFAQVLADHASGFLAPLIRKLTVHWNTDILRKGIAFVDLPGVGVAGDVHREITREFIRNQADAVVLVTTYRGFKESVVETLKSTNFLNRLLMSLDDPAADPLVLVVAVVRLDEVAEEDYLRDKTVKRRDHLKRAIEGTVERTKQELRRQLLEEWTSEVPEMVEAKRLTLDRILSNMHVCAMSTIQYRKLLADDEDSRAFIREADDSGVPGMQQVLEQLAQTTVNARLARASEVRETFHRRLVSRLEYIQAEWQSETRATEDAERLRLELRDFLWPRREEFRSRQGQFREFLKNTVPVMIDNNVGKARNNASKDIQAYLRKLDDYHWKTLQATVRKEGTHSGVRSVDLPAELADCFDEHVAAVWGNDLVRGIRSGTKAYADDCVRLVEDVVTWAKEQGARVQTALLEKLRDAIRADAKRTEEVGKEKIDELRENVKAEIRRVIEDPIRRKCRAFVAANRHVGSGTKQRTLDLFNTLAWEISEAAGEKAKDILTTKFKVVRRDIEEIFKEHEDPLVQAEEALVASHEQVIKRSDAQRRKKILASVSEVLRTAPKI